MNVLENSNTVTDNSKWYCALENYNRLNMSRVFVVLRNETVALRGIQIDRTRTSKGCHYQIRETVGKVISILVNFSHKDVDVENMTKEDYEFIRMTNPCNNSFVYDILPMLKDLVDGKEQWNNVSEKIEEIYVKYR